MKFRKFVVVAALVVAGSLALAPMVRADDDDHDGVRNSKDQCPWSDINPLVIIGGCDPSNVPNAVDPVGCTIQDYMEICGYISSTQSDFLACIDSVANYFQSLGDISGKQGNQLRKCAKK